MDNTEYPQPLWERAVAMLKQGGQPITAQSIQAAMNKLAGDPDPASGSSVDDTIDRTMQTAANPAKVEQRSLTPAPIKATGRFIGNDAHANHNLVWDAAELGMLDQAKGAMASDGPDSTSKTYILNGQGPAKLNGSDAMAPDARGGANTTSDTSNYVPGTQDASGNAAAPYWNAPVAPNGMATEASGISGDGAMKGGILAAIIATLSKRHKPSMGQSIHLGNVHAPQAASQYEGVITKATPEEIAKYYKVAKYYKGGGSVRPEDLKRPEKDTGVRSRTAKRRKKDEDE